MLTGGEVRWLLIDASLWQMYSNVIETASLFTWKFLDPPEADCLYECLASTVFGSQDS